MQRKTEQEQRDLFPGALEMMILQIVRREPTHGYALAQTIKQASEDLLQVEDGSLYPALTRMLKAGWLTADWGLSARSRKVRTYRITAAGRKQLAREVSGFKQMMDGITRVMRTAEP
ncbi:MAG TPA: PadR family transcriptional regulator [Bryobacteraceae bacterium]|jgi:transcriptional regulator|nr:PadR family transcriptional regulator [Bryobacteraceae bacterium]